ncbi:MAG: hypothetical protein QOF21_254 [Actinomycetota bacterium]
MNELGELIERAVTKLPPQVRKFLEGKWLGHPLHPLLTDLPIGFWTTSWVLDLLGRKRSARTAAAMVGLGVATAVPTIAAGAVDWTTLPDEKKETGLLHMLCNIAATALYFLSFAARVRGRRGKGVALGMLGASAATVGGYLGGHLVFGSSDEDEASDAQDAATVTRLAG